MKFCPGCKLTRPFSDFQKNKKAADGLQYHCRSCRKVIDSRPEKRAGDRALHRAHPERARNRGLKTRYKISLADFDALLSTQNGRCAACRSDVPGSKRGWHVDHDHKTSRVRGILCSPCNLMLGHAKDNPAQLRAAADYLERQ